MILRWYFCFSTRKHSLYLLSLAFFFQTGATLRYKNGVAPASLTGFLVPSIPFSGFYSAGTSRFRRRSDTQIFAATAAKALPATMIAKRSVQEFGPHDLSDKRVLVRCDLNVPMDGSQIVDDTRLKASLKTIQYLQGYGAKVILTSHFGRPKGREEKYSLRQIRQRMQELLQRDIEFCEECVGEKAKHMIDKMNPGDVLLLENVRFYPGETKNDPDFAMALASLADIYVNDAFGAAHRAHASTAGVTKFLKPAVAGMLLEKEVEYLSGVIENAKRPFAAIIGGSKVSTKIGVLEAMLEKVDKMVIGGAMAFTFLKARGLNVGSSIVEDDKMEIALKLEKLAKEKGVEIILPTDVVIADAFTAEANSRVVKVDRIPDGWWALDNGPETTDTIRSKLADCETVMWNGPMGVAEFEQFAAGTVDVAKFLAELTRKGATTIVGGGDSVAAAERAHVGEFLTHLSTGGGASLELLEGKKLAGVEALDDKRIQGA